MEFRLATNTDSSCLGGALFGSTRFLLAAPMSKPDFDKTVASLIAEFSQSGIAELNLHHGDFEFYLSSRSDLPSVRRVSLQRRAAAPAQASAAPASPALAGDQTRPLPQERPAVELPADARIITAPNLGTFYRAPKPGAAPYVEVGAIIAEGEDLCLIEVMKLFTAVRTDRAGRLHSVLAEDGSMVEAGQPLFALVDA